MYDITIIGAMILDVLAQPVCKEQLSGPSCPADHIVMDIGGDAANEAIILSRLGKKVHLITKLGTDMAGRLLLDHCKSNHIASEDIVLTSETDTGINVVLVDPHAERSFITNNNSTLRRLAPEDVPDQALGKSPIVCFASIFVSPCFNLPQMADLFRRVKERGSILCADMTRRKKGETLEDARQALRYVDYLFPNYEEASLLSGKTDLNEIADAFLDCGVSCIVIKIGKDGCFIKTKNQQLLLPAVPGTNCLDTTGAGDNFAAGFLYALSEGMSLADCGRFANATASVAVEAIGACTGVQSLSQVLERLQKS